MMVAAVPEGSKVNEQRWKSGKVTGRDRREGGSDQRKRDVICFYCNKKGHMRRECRQKKEDEKMFTNE